MCVSKVTPTLAEVQQGQYTVGAPNNTDSAAEKAMNLNYDHLFSHLYPKCFYYDMAKIPLQTMSSAGRYHITNILRE
jgi:hypothetical protein